MGDVLAVALTFARDRWIPGDRAFDLRRRRALARFLRRDLAAAPFYRAYRGRALPELPIVDKATVLADFAAFNRHGITLDRALSVARAAERSRDFRPTIDGVTVGLSSGTSGRPGVFLVSDRERRRWAGTIMARLLSPAALRLLRTRGLRVALFLRANSNLYETLRSRRVRFTYHDLIRSLDVHVPAVAGTDVLVAPPSVLRDLADRVALRPTQVIAVGETLEPDDAAAVRAAFGVRVEQVYQATEGLLGFGCTAERVHLNEAYVHVEPQWLDERRFVPIVTDFTRTTQLVVRYRLDDVLLAAPGPCPCGRPGRAVDAVLGRVDDVLALCGGPAEVPAYPDVVRHAVALAPGVADYRIEQRGAAWHLAVRAADPDAAHAAITAELATMAGRLGAPPPPVAPMPWPAEPAGQKRRRLRRVRTR